MPAHLLRATSFTDGWKLCSIDGKRCSHGNSAGVLHSRIHRTQSFAMIAHVKRAEKPTRSRALQGRAVVEEEMVMY